MQTIIKLTFLKNRKIAKDSSAKYYLNNKEGLQKKAREEIKVLLKMKNKKSDNMVVNDTKSTR